MFFYTKKAVAITVLMLWALFRVLAVAAAVLAGAWLSLTIPIRVAMNWQEFVAESPATIMWVMILWGAGLILLPVAFDCMINVREWLRTDYEAIIGEWQARRRMRYVR